MELEYPDNAPIINRQNVSLQENERQKKAAYEWLVEFNSLNGFAPTLREMAEAWQCTPPAAANLINSLEDDNWIKTLKSDNQRLPRYMEFLVELEAS